MKPVIHPYVEIGRLSQKALRAMSFRIREIDLDRTKENWLRLYVSWSAKKDEWKVKYPTVDGTESSHGGGAESSGVSLSFPEIAGPYDVAKDYKAHLDIGIHIKTGRALNPPRITHRYQFTENVKYGVLVWFAPRDWNDGKRDRELVRYRPRA